MIAPPGKEGDVEMLGAILRAACEGCAAPAGKAVRFLQ